MDKRWTKDGAILGYFEVFWDESPPPLSPYPMGCSKVSTPRGTLSTEEGETSIVAISPSLVEGVGNSQS